MKTPHLKVLVECTVNTAVDLARYIAHLHTYVAIDPLPNNRWAVLVKEEIADQRCKEFLEACGVAVRPKGGSHA